MKKLNFILFMALIILLSQNSFSQCNVSNGVLEDGTKYYKSGSEKLYDSGKLYGDLENGFLVVYAHLILYEDSKTNIFSYGMTVMVCNKGSYEMVIPRKIIIDFEDGTNIEILSETLTDRSTQMKVPAQESKFSLTSINFDKLQNASISQITILDNRTSQQIIAKPYKDILKEEVICLLKYK